MRILLTKGTSSYYARINLTIGGVAVWGGTEWNSYNNATPWTRYYRFRETAGVDTGTMYSFDEWDGASTWTPRMTQSATSITQGQRDAIRAMTPLNEIVSIGNTGSNTCLLESTEIQCGQALTTGPTIV